MTEVALFPIPDVVAFPGTIVPLHVFEPRYRKMIHECVEQQRMIGVCHTRKEIRAARPNQTVSDALNTNQATYEPCNVFSAGLCEIMDTTEDGRIYVNINMTTRLSLASEVQTLPYRIVNCTTVEDGPVDESAPGIHELKRAITDAMIQLAGRGNLPLNQVLADDRWIGLEAEKFSFKVFQFIRFDADEMQLLLEMTDTLKRLQIINACLSEGIRQ